MERAPAVLSIALVLTLVTAAHATTAAAPAPPIFTEGFEEGAAGWSFTGLWHVERCIAHAGAASIAYNDACNTYDVGTTSGSATSPSIPLDGLATRLSWATWYETEGGTEFDQMSIFASYDEGATWSQVFVERGPNTMFEWKPREIVLGDPQGATLRLRFHFDSVDERFNQNMGWFVDDIIVDHVATAPSPPRELAAAPGPDIGTIGLTWLAPDSDGGTALTGYDVFSVEGDATTKLASLSADATAYTASGLEPLSTYRFHVVAKNVLGASEPSNEACAKPFPWVTFEGDCDLAIPLRP